MKNRKVIIVALDANLPKLLSERFQAASFAVHDTSSLTAAANLVGDLNLPLLLVHLGNKISLVEPAFRQLFADPKLQRCPLLVVGDNLSRYSGKLQNHFSLFGLLDCKQDSHTIVDLAVDLTTSFEAERSDEDTGENIRTPDFGNLQPKNKRISSMIVALDEVEKGALEEFAKQYPFTRSFDDIKSLPCLPKNREVRLALKEYIANTGSWQNGHIARTIYGVSAFVETSPHKIQEELENARAATALFSWALASDLELMRAEYYREEHAHLRKKICSKIKDSAMRVAMELQLPEVANIISTVAKLIGEESVAGDDNASRIASAIVANDILGRSCWQSGHWNPRGGYLLLIRFKLGKGVNNLDPEALAAATTLLTSAMNSRLPAIMVPRELRENPKLLEIREMHKKARPGPGEAKVSLSALTPGMRLSQPLIAYDGQTVLDEKIRLDEDLIWRIWQLSTILPLNQPMIVSS